MARSIAEAWMGFAVAISLSATLADDSVRDAVAKAEAVTLGAAMPEFSCFDDCGQEWKSNQHVGGKVVVMYFYPGDFTEGCTNQAATFQRRLGATGRVGRGIDRH